MIPSPETGEAAPTAASRLAAIVAGAFGWLAAAVILVILALTAANVGGRYLADAPIRGAEELTGYLVVVIVMFGVAECYRREEHIRVDVLSTRYGRFGRAALAAASHLAALGIAAALLYTGWHTAHFSYGFGAYSSGYLEAPMWIPQSTLVVGGALLGLIALLRLVDLAARRG